MSIIVKRDGTEERLYPIKIQNAITAVFEETQNDNYEAIEDLTDEVINFISDEEYIDVEEIQDTIEFFLFKHKYFNELKAFIIYRIEHSVLRKNLNDKQYFLEKYKQSKNTADATIDDNSNVSSKNLAILSILCTFDLLLYTFNCSTIFLMGKYDLFINTHHINYEFLLLLALMLQ